MAWWSVLLVTLAASGIIAGAGFAVYKYRIRYQMHQEVRQIMSQYMPLESDGNTEEKETLQGGL